MLRTMTCGAGAGECPDGLYDWFATAWAAKADTQLMISGPGTNMLPLIHVADLAHYVLSVAETQPIQQYLLAVDDSRLTQADIARAISSSLGSGATCDTDADGLFYTQVIFCPSITKRMLRAAWHECYHLSYFEVAED